MKAAAVRRLLPVAVFTGAYVLVALAAAMSGNAEFLFYLGSWPS